MHLGRMHWGKPLGGGMTRYEELNNLYENLADIAWAYSPPEIKEMAGGRSYRAIFNGFKKVGAGDGVLERLRPMMRAEDGERRRRFRAKKRANAATH